MIHALVTKRIGMVGEKCVAEIVAIPHIPDKKETHHIELFNSQEDHA